MERIKNPLLRTLVYLLLAIWLLYSVAPFFWSALNSIKYPIEANDPNPRIVGFTPTADNYAELWLYMEIEEFVPVGMGILAVLLLLSLFYGINKRTEWMTTQRAGFLVAFGIVLLIFIIPKVAHMAKFYDYFLNSAIVTIGTLVVSISIGCLGGYALARYSGIWGVIILIAALAFRALPRMAFVLPYFYLGQATNLYDTHFLLIVTLVAINQPFTIWMLRSFFMDIPKELEEAAMIDGASRIQAFLRVIIPITFPGIITTSLFTLLLSYNEFLLPRILTQSNWTLPVAIASFTSGEDAAYKTIAAAASVSITIPIIIIITIFQKHLVKGLAFGAVKG